MKLVVLLGAAVCALFAAATPVQQVHEKIADKQFVARQKDILRLFRYINQPSYYKDFVEIGQTYKIRENVNSYSRPEVVEMFWKYYESDYIPRGEVFSVFYEDNLKVVDALFKLFYYAKDYETFFKTAVWARQNVNEGLFLYTCSVAIVYRPDTYGLILPPIYEIYPFYFFSSEYIQQAYNYKQRYNPNEKENYTIYVNNSYYYTLNPDQNLLYYLEDVGINSFYYYYNVFYPFWLDGEEFKLKYERRGEQFYFIHQQLLARYYLERLSNGKGQVPYFDWEQPFEEGYYPFLRYPNGVDFPSRPYYANLKDYFYSYGQRWCSKERYGYNYEFIRDYERRIRDAIDKGYIFNDKGERVDLFGPEGFDIFSSLVQANADSPNYRYYGPLQIFARHLLGYSYQPSDKYGIAPSALEHFETSLRDPAFYSLIQRFLLLFQKYKSYLSPYTYKELYFSGVQVEKVEFVNKLETYFDFFDSDVSNALYARPEEFEQDVFFVKARQCRLNHKPFAYKVTVKSDKDVKASIRVYLGPKYDRYGWKVRLNENRLNYVTFDVFTYDLKAGTNVIERHCNQNTFYKPDRTSYRDLYRQVVKAQSGKEELKINGTDNYFGFPNRYLLPKGSYGGTWYQFVFSVNPYVPVKKIQGQHEPDHANHWLAPKVGTQEQYVDGYPLGYPFDRHIEYPEYFFNATNMYFYDEKVYFTGYGPGYQQRPSELLKKHHI